MKKNYDIKEKNPVIMGVGKKAFYKIVKELKEDKNISYSVKYTSEYRSDWAGKTERGLKKGKDVRVLTRYDDETKKDVKKWLKINKNIKNFENQGVAINITEHEIMISLIKSNVTLLIRDKAFTKIMKKMFLASYDDAEKIK